MFDTYVFFISLTIAVACIMLVLITLALITKNIIEIRGIIEEAFGLWNILQAAKDDTAALDEDAKQQLARHNMAFYAEDDDPDREDPDIRRMKQENRGFYS
ncbi:MAG TPA: hypothetical protein PK985_05595 [Bacillota bacterium]|nr:hypothetical protein [Bacillota bacterium]